MPSMGSQPKLSKSAVTVVLLGEDFFRPAPAGRFIPFVKGI
jgi:hypothetical protein